MFVMFQVPGSPGPPGPMVSGGAQTHALGQLSVTTTPGYSDLTGPLRLCLSMEVLVLDALCEIDRLQRETTNTTSLICLSFPCTTIDYSVVTI